MRVFIKMSAGLFVIAGIIGFVVAIFFVVMSIKQGFFSAAAALILIFGAAGSTLIGGTAYMLCSIDERLETLGARNPAAR